MRDAYTSFKHNTSLAMLVIAPVLIAIPPRKLDLYTFALGGAFVLSANQLTKERTGVGLLSQWPGGAGGERLTPQAQEFQAQMRAQKDRKRLLDQGGVPDEVSQRTAGGGRPVNGLEEKARQLWMGGETEGWKERRLKEEQEKLAQGEGYGSMILDQIWEVWNWDEKKGKELQKKDMEIVAAQQKQAGDEQARG